MEGKFFTSTEAAEITRCSRRQLQYWRETGVITPTVNTSGKGRNVYYSVSDLLALTIMEYLLSIGLNFDICRGVLEKLRQKESWLFEEPITSDAMKQLMLLLTDSHNQSLRLVEFDKQEALDALYQGQAVVPFWSDLVRERLRQGLKNLAVS